MNVRTFASPLMIAAFLAVAVTGILMLLGYREGLVTPVHEWSSLIFVLGAVLHIAIHWKPTLAHVKRPLGAALLALFLLITMIAVIPQGQGSGGNPGHKSIGLMLDADLATLARLTKTSEQVLLMRLNANGFSAPTPTSTVRQIAASAQRNPMKVLNVLLTE